MLSRRLFSRNIIKNVRMHSTFNEHHLLLKDTISRFSNEMISLWKKSIPAEILKNERIQVQILEIAKMVTKKINSEIIITESNDPRSYRQDSSKLLNTGFTPKYSVETAIDDVIKAYNSGKVKGSDDSYTVKWMKKNKIGF